VKAFHTQKAEQNVNSSDYSAVLFNYMNRGSLCTRSCKHTCIHLSDFRYKLTENGFMGLKSFWGF